MPASSLTVTGVAPASAATPAGRRLLQSGSGNAVNISLGVATTHPTPNGAQAQAQAYATGMTELTSGSGSNSYVSGLQQSGLPAASGATLAAQPQPVRTGLFAGLASDFRLGGNGSAALAALAAKECAAGGVAVFALPVGLCGLLLVCGIALCAVHCHHTRKNQQSGGGGAFVSTAADRRGGARPPQRRRSLVERMLRNASGSAEVQQAQLDAFSAGFWDGALPLSFLFFPLRFSAACACFLCAVAVVPWRLRFLDLSCIVVTHYASISCRLRRGTRGRRAAPDPARAGRGLPAGGRARAAAGWADAVVVPGAGGCTGSGWAGQPGVVRLSTGFTPGTAAWRCQQPSASSCRHETSGEGMIDV